MKKAFSGILFQASVFIKDFSERIKVGWVAIFGKSLYAIALRKIKTGWLNDEHCA
jgi:hypothetical protein